MHSSLSSDDVGITQCYLLPDTSGHTPPSPQPDRQVLDLPIPDGWKAELT